MNIAGLTAALVSWAAAAASTATVFYGEPNGPRPPSPSVRLKIIAGPTLIGLDEVTSVPDNPNDFNLQGPRELTLSVMATGATAHQLASDLITSLSDPNVQDSLWASNLTSLSTSPIRDVSALVETKWEERFQFDVELMATEQTTIQPGVIESVAGSGTATGTASGTPITSPFKSPP